MELDLVAIDAQLAFEAYANIGTCSKKALAFITDKDASRAVIAPTGLDQHVRHFLVLNEQMGSLNPRQVADALYSFTTYWRLNIDPKIAFPGCSEHAFEIAREHGCSYLYEAFYIAFARSYDCPLWTTNDRLRPVAIGCPWIKFIQDLA